MVRGLATREFFLAVDAVLGLILAVSVPFMAKSIQSIAPTAPPVEVPAGDANGTGTAPLPAVGARSQYDKVVSGGLFGEAGRWNPQAAPSEPPPKPEETAIEETQLNLRLHGTIATKSGDPNASAFIEDTVGAAGTVKGYALGEAVGEKITLLDVFPRRVVILNEQGGESKKEYLSMDDPEGETETAKAGQPGLASGGKPGPGAKPNAPNTKAKSAAVKTGPGSNVAIDKEEFVRDLYKHYVALSAIQPIEKKDAQGNFIGLTADGISKLPLADKLGFQDGDVLQNINGEQVSNEQQIMEIIQRNQRAANFQIGILRDNQPMTINYRLR